MYKLYVFFRILIVSLRDNFNCMKNRFLTLIALFFIIINGFAQNSKETKGAYYYKIPEYPKEFSAGTVAARVVDGLGFRYYWATEGLRDVDLNYKPNDSARTSLETIDHIYNLSNVIVNATLKRVNDFTLKKPVLNYKEKRIKTLENIKQASDILKMSSAKELEKFTIIFKSKKGTTTYPFWNNLNGPIADALWHTGQVVLLRRASGNPFNSKVSLLRGEIRSN